MNSKVHTPTHKPDLTKINIKGFDVAKSAAQLLYGPVLVFIQTTRKRQALHITFLALQLGLPVHLLVVELVAHNPV